jgi:hypothetical protein
MILVALGSSAQLLVIGILGAYVGRIYEEVQRRPLYTVARGGQFRATRGRSDREERRQFRPAEG